MVDANEVEQLKADLELVTKTSKVLANKLEKISARIENIFASMEGVTIPKPAPKKIVEPKPTPTPKPSPSPSVQVTSTGGSAKTGRLLDSFLSQVQTITKGSEIAKALSHLRDQVMQSAEVGFHPAFHEMGRYANQIKNIREISSTEKEQLIEKVYDWKTRLAG